MNLTAVLAFISVFVSCDSNTVKQYSAYENKKFKEEKRDSLYKVHGCERNVALYKIENKIEDLKNFKQSDAFIEELNNKSKTVYQKYKSKFDELKLMDGFHGDYSYDEFFGNFGSYIKNGPSGTEFEKIRYTLAKQFSDEINNEMEILKEKYSPYYSYLKAYPGAGGDVPLGWYVLESSKSAMYKKTAYVYDSKLKNDFFADVSADYELVSKGDNKWQVVKTDKNGKISKTHVFSDKGDVHEGWGSYDKDDKDRFVATQGKNMGVKIYQTVIKEVKHSEIQNDAIDKSSEIAVLEKEYEVAKKKQKQIDAARAKADAELKILMEQRVQNIR